MCNCYNCALKKQNKTKKQLKYFFPEGINKVWHLILMTSLYICTNSFGLMF